ncbi:MAG: SdrD B-like domain-containing protein [Saprospiraceae bacterium]|nr:SdrD B-like domain-containing protein [Saprospiraceae bacterium]
MKAFIPYHFSTFNYRFLCYLLFLLPSLTSWSYPSTAEKPSAVVLSNITGSIWVETDGNAMDNGESGPSGVIVSLIDSDQDTLVAQTTSVLGEYSFNQVSPGKYYILIDNNAFLIGGALFNLNSCLGFNDANNMVDNDDNGTDTAPGDVFSTTFTLDNADPMNDVPIEYIDFCFFANCDQPNPFAVESCDAFTGSETFCEILNLDNLCALMPSDSVGGIQPTPLCDGFSNSENISWLSFVAGGGSYTMTITPFNCPTGTLGPKGIQVGLYTDCSFEEAAFCSDCTDQPIEIGAGSLISGQVYYMYINGCNGNVCNYSIDISGNPTTPSLEPDDVCVFSNGNIVCNDLSYCPNSDISINARGVGIVGEYSWSINTLGGPPYPGNPNPVTSTDTVQVNFPTEGKYEVCIEQISNGCPSQTWTGSICRQIDISSAIPQPEDEDFGETFVCEDNIDDFTVFIFANQDPNGDGDFGWNAASPDQVLGLNTGIVYTEGCSYQQQFTLSSYPSTPVADVLVSVCEQDLPIQVDVLNFSLFSFGGESSLSFDSLLLINSQDQNGCDSIINLTVEKLNILQGSILEPECTLEGISLVFDYIEDLSTDINFLEFEWTDPSGNVLSFGADPTTVLAPFSSGSGIYNLTVTINKNGELCSYAYSTVVNIASFLPSTPVVSGPLLVCEGDMLSVYTAEFVDDETNFIWSFPNDVSSASVSGMNDENLTINWTGSNGGQIVALAQNNCGQSNQVTIDVEIIQKVTPEFTIPASVCIENAITITYFGTGINVSNYLWDFGDATILSGSGMGPYEVLWGDSGEKPVSLITTDLNGCISNKTEKTVAVDVPIEAPLISCMASIGQVTFTWDIPAGTAGFEVNVLSGQMGGVLDNNSFTITGLSEGENVQIELLSFPENTICGDFVSTSASCISQDCTAPVVVLESLSSVCVDGDPLTISATITSGESGTGVFSGPGIIDEVNGVFDPSLANIGINTILYSFVSDIGDCEGSAMISIEVFNLPVASFTQDPDSLCITDDLSLVYTGTVNASLDWDLGGGIGFGLLTNQTVEFTSPGLKEITLQVTKDGCVSNVASSTVLVEPELESLNVVCDTAGTDFLIFSWNEITGVSEYEVKVDNNPSIFSSNTSITVSGLEENQVVSIAVTSISNTSCPGSTSFQMCITGMSVSTAESILDGVTVFPNPLQNKLYVESSAFIDISYDLYSLLGIRVKSGRIENGSVDFSFLPQGVYIIRLWDVKTNSHRDLKIVKE